MWILKLFKAAAICAVTLGMVSQLCGQDVSNAAVPLEILPEDGVTDVAFASPDELVEPSAYLLEFPVGTSGALVVSGSVLYVLDDGKQTVLQYAAADASDYSTLVLEACSGDAGGLMVYVTEGEELREEGVSADETFGGIVINPAELHLPVQFYVNSGALKLTTVEIPGWFRALELGNAESIEGQAEASQRSTDEPEGVRLTEQERLELRAQQLLLQPPTRPTGNTENGRLRFVSPSGSFKLLSPHAVHVVIPEGTETTRVPEGD